MVPDEDKKRFFVDYVTAVSKFSSAMQKFPVKKILYRNMFRGRGLEFDSYRAFESDDDASLIDWMASLRAQSLMARKYIEERDLHVYFLFDVSNSMLFGSGNKLKAEYAAEFILALSHLILESGDQVGLIMFNDNVVNYVPPGSGKKHFFQLVNSLSDPKYYGGDFLVDRPIEFLFNTINSEYNVFIIVSDFIKFQVQSERFLNMLSIKYETVAVMVRDPFDEKLPDTKYQFMISDPYSDRQFLLDPELAGEEYEAFVREHKKKIMDLFLRSGIDVLELNTAEEFYFPASAFLRRRAKGVRI